MGDIEITTLKDAELISNDLTEFDDFWNINILKEELENPNSMYIIAKKDNEILGFAGIWDDTYNMHITNIAVKKIYRRQGIGKKLLYRLIQITKEKNKETITLEVSEKNKIAQELYKSTGFNIVGKRKNYYNGKEDAIIMTMEVTNEKK